MSIKKAFTLAETMITLTIIGVVAAILIPSVSQNINDKAFTDSKDIFSKKLVEAMSQMRTADKMSGYSNNQEFLDEFQNYMRVIRTCDNAHLTDCFASTIFASDGEEVDVADKMKTGKSFGKDTNTTPLVGAMFANRTSAIIAYDPACVQQSPFETADPTSCLSILYDINGFKKPNKAGRDIMPYHVDKLGYNCTGIEISGSCLQIDLSDTAVTPINTCNGSSAWDSTYTSAVNAGCSSNYWAGAKKACSDKSMRLPTSAELAEIASKTYGTTIGETEDISSGISVVDNSLSFVNLGIGTNFWSQENCNSFTAYGRYFADTRSDHNDFTKNSASVKARCVKND